MCLVESAFNQTSGFMEGLFKNFSMKHNSRHDKIMHYEA